MEGTASVTVETVTALLVGMETNVSFSVTSAHGRARGDAHLQTTRSAATGEPVCAGSVHATTWTLQGTGATYMVTRVSVTRGAAMPPTTDMRMTSAQVMASVTVGGVTVRRAGLGGSVNTLCPAPSLWRAV